MSAYLSVDSVGGQEHRGLRRTVDLLLQDLLLHLRSCKTQVSNKVYLLLLHCQTKREFTLLEDVGAALVRLFFAPMFQIVQRISFTSISM